MFVFQSFTSIVGPNGSGKSNVIDSMLFVFGYRASKIRSKKISVLLHKSENHPDIRSCTVAVHFARIIDFVSYFTVIYYCLIYYFFFYSAVLISYQPPSLTIIIIAFKYIRPPTEF